MAENQPTDADLAAKVRAAAQAFNAAVDEAAAAGLFVTFGVSQSMRSPVWSHIHEMTIERRADWSREYPGERL